MQSIYKFSYESILGRWRDPSRRPLAPMGVSFSTGIVLLPDALLNPLFENLYPLLYSLAKKKDSLGHLEQ